MAFELGELLLAFRWHVARLVVEDDLVTTGAEREFLGQKFPDELLRRHGFMDEQGEATERFHDAAVEALSELPKRLSAGDKYQLLEEAYSAAVADDELRVGEGSVVLMASRLLGLSDPEFDAFLEGRRDAAGISAAVLDHDI